MARGRKDYEKAVIVVESEGYQDLHGRILMNDTFEDTPLKWIGTGAGTWSVTRQQRAAYNGSLGLELSVISELPPGERYANAERMIPTDLTRRIRTELFFRINRPARMIHFTINIDHYDGERLRVASLRYVVATTRWQYRSPLAGFVDIPGGVQVLQDDAWNEITFDVDFAINNYIRVKSNNLEINMAALGMPDAFSALGPHAIISLEAVNNTGLELILSTDDIVVKELER